MRWMIAHWTALIALCFALPWLAYWVHRCRKQLKDLDAAIRQCERVLAYYGARGKPHLKLDSPRIGKHLRRSFFKDRLDGLWVFEVNESIWCRDNLTEIPKIISLEHHNDVYLVFASENDAFAFKIRWF